MTTSLLSFQTWTRIYDPWTHQVPTNWCDPLVLPCPLIQKWCLFDSQLLLWCFFQTKSRTTNQLVLIPLPPLKPVIATPQLKLHQLQAYNAQTALMSINTSFHPLIPFQLTVPPFFRAPISLSTAPRLLIQYITTNIATTLLFRNRQQLSDHGSTPNFAMAWNPSSTLGKLSIGTTNGKNWLFRIQLCLPNASRFPRSCCCLSSFRTLISLDAFFKLYPVPPSFPLSPQIKFCSFSVGWVIALWLPLKPYEKSQFYDFIIKKSWN